jgi:predicted peroxiredoxin
LRAERDGRSVEQPVFFISSQNNHISAGVTTSVTPQGASVKVLAERFLKQGGKISVCAIYLPNRKLSPDALIDGVSVANPKQMADKSVDPAVRVIGQ